MKNFTTLKKILVMTVFGLLLGNHAYAQFSLSGEVRPRMEYLHGYSTLTDKDADPAGFASQRTRINFNYANDRVKMGVSMQDVFIWGSQPQLFSTSNSLSVHQAWGQYFLTPTLSLKLGRQELSYDDERIFGASNWDQQGRSHDVALLRYDGMLRIDIGAAFNQDRHYLSGAYYRLNNYKMMQFVWLNTDIVDNLNLSLLFLNNGYQREKDMYNSDQTDEKKHTIFNQTLGGRIVFTPGNFNIHATANAITGSRISCPTNPSATALGFLATFVKAFLSRSIPKRNISTMSIGITIHIVFMSGVFLRSFYCFRKNKAKIFKNEL